MPMHDDYEIALDSFRGPLDLLLYLIRRAEVDIHDIPIATITDQYLAYLKRIDHIDIDLAGEFLVMAASLIELKSRTLMPADQQAAAAADENNAIPDSLDPRYELVQQLLAYQKYRIAAEELEDHRTSFNSRFAVHAHSPGEARAFEAAIEAHESGAAEDDDSEPIDLELEDAHIMDLFEAFERIMSSIDLTRLGDHRVEIDDTPIALHQADILDQMNRSAQRRISLNDAFVGKSRGQIIGLFLATLELVRLRRVIVKQDVIAGEIVLTLNEDPDFGAAETPHVTVVENGYEGEPGTVDVDDGDEESEDEGEI